MSLAPLHFPEAWFAKPEVAWNYEKIFLYVFDFHILGFEFASCLRQCTRKYFEENYEEFDYNQLDIYHYANMKFYRGRNLFHCV